MHHRSFIEMGQLSHIVSFVKLGWVDFIDIIGVNVSFLEKLRLATMEEDCVSKASGHKAYTPSHRHIAL